MQQELMLPHREGPQPWQRCKFDHWGMPCTVGQPQLNQNCHAAVVIRATTPGQLAFCRSVFCCRMTAHLRTRGDTTLCAVVWHCTLRGFHSLCWTGYHVVQVSIWRAGSVCCHETMVLQHSPHADVRVRRQPSGVAPHLSRVVIFSDSASTALQQVTCIQEREISCHETCHLLMSAA